jgi:hypothetical protein
MQIADMSHRALVARLRQLPHPFVSPTDLYAKLGTRPDDPFEFWPDSVNALGRALSRLEDRTDLGVWISRRRSNGRRLWEIRPLVEPVTAKTTEPDLLALVD